MKKTLSYLLILIVPLLLSACSDERGNKASSQKSSSQEPTQQPVATDSKPAITGADAPTEKSQIKADPSLLPLPIEKTGNVAVLPKDYPKSWVLVDEASFFNMFGGKVIIVDVAEDNPAKQIKGLMDKSLLGNFTQSKKHNEFYIIESFHERGSRGKKTDVLAIYDNSTLSIKKEIVWPKANRLQALPERYAMSVSSDQRFLYSSNFDPAASFTVVDLNNHEIVTEVATPGCVLTYPVGLRSVASLCSNGAMLTTQLNDDGSLKSQTRGEPFFDTTNTPIFEHAVYIDGIAYYPSFKGLLHSFDMRGEQANYLGSWDMLDEQQQAANWRPSGLALNDYDDAGMMYTIFQPDGREGSQTHGGAQVWVYDVKSKQRVRVIETPKWAISIAVTRGENPLLIVTNGELNLDIFDARSGEQLRTIAGFGNSTPLLVHKSH